MSKEVQLVHRVSGLYAGTNTEFVEGIASGIGHKLAQQALEVGKQEVEGDWQADRKHHGGSDRVLHHFPREHYGQYRRWDMITSMQDAPSMGENISTVGLNETQINIGDVVKIGSALLQVTQPRSPCFKLNLQFGHPGFAHAMQTSSLCGWFYRVLTAGIVPQDTSIVLVNRLSDVSIAEAMHIYFLPEFDAQQYLRLLNAEGLAESWRGSLQRRLDNECIEDWRMRLNGPDLLGSS